MGNYKAICHSDLTGNQQQKALTSITKGKEVVFPFLLSPTRAVTRFHNGNSLFSDWDIFNMKPTHQKDEITSAVDAEVERRVDLRSSLKRASPAKEPPPIQKKARPTRDLGLVVGSALSPELDAARDVENLANSDHGSSQSSVREMARDLASLVNRNSRLTESLASQAEAAKQSEREMGVRIELEKVQANITHERLVQVEKEKNSRLLLEVSYESDRSKRLEEKLQVSDSVNFLTFDLHVGGLEAS